MAVRRIITNRAKKSIRNLYWRSTRKSIQRKQETKSLVDAMLELVDTTPLVPSSESRGILGIWKNKGYTIFESTHCFIRYSSGIGCKPMDNKKNLKRKWYFACVVDYRRNTIYIVNAVFAKYIDRLTDNTPTAMKFMTAMKGVITKRNKVDAERRQLTLQFPENESKHYKLQQLINECVDECLRKFLKENNESCDKCDRNRQTESELMKKKKKSSNDCYSTTVGNYWKYNGDMMPSFKIAAKGICDGIGTYINKKDKDKTYALFKRRSNNKFFWAKIKVLPNKDTKWEPISKANVPNVIFKDAIRI